MHLTSKLLTYEPFEVTNVCQSGLNNLVLHRKSVAAIKILY